MDIGWRMKICKYVAGGRRDGLLTGNFIGGNVKGPVKAKSIRKAIPGVDNAET